MRKLGDLEALVMEQLWSSSEPLSVRQVLVALPDGRNRAYTTVMTVRFPRNRRGISYKE